MVMIAGAGYFGVYLACRAIALAAYFLAEMDIGIQRRFRRENSRRPASACSAGTGGRERVDFFGLKHRARVLQAGCDVVMTDSGIIAENVGLGPSLTQQADNKINRQAS